jgi:hypothetical protein
MFLEGCHLLAVNMPQAISSHAPEPKESRVSSNGYGGKANSIVSLDCPPFLLSLNLMIDEAKKSTVFLRFFSVEHKSIKAARTLWPII